MTDAVKQLYAEIATLVRTQCQRFGCNDAATFTGDCCTLQECQETARQAGNTLPSALPVQDHQCTLLPHQRPRCALHVCNRVKRLSTADFLAQYEALRKNLDHLLQK